MNEQEQLNQLDNAMLQKISWEKTQDPLFPYRYTSGNTEWLLRLNDFPEEPMYTLIENKKVIGSFDDWPSTWGRFS